MLSLGVAIEVCNFLLSLCLYPHTSLTTGSDSWAFSNYLPIIFPRIVSTCSLNISEWLDLFCESHFTGRFGKSLCRK